VVPLVFFLVWRRTPSFPRLNVSFEGSPPPPLKIHVRSRFPRPCFLRKDFNANRPPSLLSICRRLIPFYPFLGAFIDFTLHKAVCYNSLETHLSRLAGPLMNHTMYDSTKHSFDGQTTVNSGHSTIYEPPVFVERPLLGLPVMPSGFILL